MIPEQAGTQKRGCTDQLLSVTSKVCVCVCVCDQAVDDQGDRAMCKCVGGITWSGAEHFGKGKVGDGGGNTR